MVQFQFLIGWLQTQITLLLQQEKQGFNSSQVGYKHTSTCISIININMFQFLIGWLQTYPNEITTNATMVFQFLIGWLQTTGGTAFRIFSVGVSIPHRLATNCRAYKYALSRKEQFQFLIGWLQTVILKLRIGFQNLVSIPHRLATN